MAGKVLNIAADPFVADVRKQVLETGGYDVTSAQNILEVVEACETQDFDAVVLGQTIPMKEKRRITATVRERCKARTPVIGLYTTSPAEVDDADLAISAQEPQALLDGLKRLLDTNFDRMWKQSNPPRGEAV